MLLASDSNIRLKAKKQRILGQHTFINGDSGENNAGNKHSKEK